MKSKVLLILFVLVFHFLAHSQTNTVFNNKYSNYNTLFSVVEHNGFLYVEDYSTGKNIMKIDMFGNLINSISIPYEDSPFSFPYNISYICTNSFLVSAGYSTDSNNVRKAVIRRIYYNLDSLLSKTFSANLFSPTAINTMFDDIKETPDGGYVVSGRYSEAVTPSAYHPYIMKLSSNLNIQWINKLDNVKYKLSTICNIELTPDMGMLLITDRNGGTVIKTTALGNILWEKDMPRDSLYIAYGNPVLHDNSSYLFACPYMYEFIPGSPNSGTIKIGIFVMKINYSTGETIWDTTYTPFYTIVGRWNLRVHNLNNEGFAISTSARLPRTAHVNLYPYYMDQGVVIDYNKYGDSIRTKQYFSPIPSDPYSWLTDMIIMPNGQRIGVGRTSGDSDGNAWVFMTDSCGVLSRENITTRDISPIVSLYPNPASDIINLLFDESLTVVSEVVIYNVLGQKVMEKILAKNTKSFQLDLQGLDSGIFLYEIRQNGVTKVTGKFIVE